MIFFLKLIVNGLLGIDLTMSVKYGEQLNNKYRNNTTDRRRERKENPLETCKMCNVAQSFPRDVIVMYSIGHVIV